MPDPRRPTARPSEIKPMRSSTSASATVPICSERVELQRRAHRDEEDDQHRQRAALDRHLERVALRHGDVLDHHAGGHRREQRLEALRRADLAQQRAHAEQHERALAGDVAQVQREQRADQAPERECAADLPRQRRQDAARDRRCRRASRVRAASAPRTARARRDRRARRSRARDRSGGRARRFPKSPPPSSSARS